MTTKQQVKARTPTDIEEQLTAIALSAYKVAHPAEYNLQSTDADGFQAEPFAVTSATTHALEAARHFVSEKAYQQRFPDFRASISGKKKGSLRQAVEVLSAHLGATELPPFYQMRNLHCFNDPEANDPKANDPGAAAMLRKERLWHLRHSPEAVASTLRLWLELMDDLHDRVGKSKMPVTAEVWFVARLAAYWEHELRASIQDSRGGPRKRDTNATANRQKGLFADFVRAAAELIPREHRKEVISWDHAIKIAIRRK